MESPGYLVKLLHSIPHVNITLHRVNDTFNPQNKLYMASLGILASIPAAFLILSLVGLLLYLLTRCCDRKPRKAKSQTCQNCVLITTTLLCCAAIGLGLYGNDDFHNGLLQTFNSGKQIKGLVFNFTNKTERLKQDIRTKVLMSHLEDILDNTAYNRTAVGILQDNVRLVRENTTKAVSELEAVLYSLRPNEREDSLKYILKHTEFYESIRWPTTLGFLTALLLLCAILVIGVARRSRCSLIFFSVFGLFAVIICWLLSGIYLASSVALGDFCMHPNEIICRQVATRPDYMNYLNCGTKRMSITKRLNESRDYIESARDIFKIVSRMSKEIFPRVELGKTIDQISREFDDSREELSDLAIMLDVRVIDRTYGGVVKGICGGGLFGLSLMMAATFLTALLLTILVCVDSHTWIYLRKKRPYGNKSEITPFLSTTTTTTATTSPTSAPILSGTSTINRTLLHHQQQHNQSIGTLSNAGGGSGSGILVGPNNHPGPMAVAARNGATSAALRGLAYSGGDSPPPDYNYVVHDNRLSGHHTLGRLPSQQHVQQHAHANYLSGPNNGKYATLSKQCKTLESNDFY